MNGEWWRELFSGTANKILTAVVFTGCVALGGFLWSVTSGGYKALQSIPQIHERLDEMAADIRLVNTKVDNIVNRGPAVEYLDNVRVIPEEGGSGRRVTLRYTMRRIRPCNDAQIEDRYLNLDSNSYETQISRRVIVGAPLHTEFGPHIETLLLPPLPPGDYAYIPVVSCKGEAPFVRPPAYFRVLLSGETTRAGNLDAKEEHQDKDQGQK